MKGFYKTLLTCQKWESCHFRVQVPVQVKVLQQVSTCLPVRVPSLLHCFPLSGTRLSLWSVFSSRPLVGPKKRTVPLPRPLFLPNPPYSLISVPLPHPSTALSCEMILPCGIWGFLPFPFIETFFWGTRTIIVWKSHLLPSLKDQHS